MIRSGIEMAKDRDILMSNGDVVIGGCDLMIGDTFGQNVSMMLTMEKGELKEYPTMGAGIGTMVADEDRAYWQREIREALKSDGMDVKSVDWRDDGVVIDARY